MFLTPLSSCSVFCLSVLLEQVEPAHVYQLHSPKNREDIAKALFRDLPQHLHSKYIWFMENCGKLPPRIDAETNVSHKQENSVDRKLIDIEPTVHQIL